MMSSYLPLLLFILSVSVFESEGVGSRCSCSSLNDNKYDQPLRFGRKKRDTEAATPLCQTTCYSVATLLNITAQDRYSGELCEKNAEYPPVLITCDDTQTSAAGIGLALGSYHSNLRNLPLISYGESVKLVVPSAVASPYIQVVGLSGRYRLAEIHFHGAFQTSGDLTLFRQLIHEKEGDEREVAVLGVAIHVPENETRKEDGWPLDSHGEKWLTKVVSTALQTTLEPGNETRVESLQVERLLPSGSDNTYFFKYAPCAKEITVKTNVSLFTTEMLERRERRGTVLAGCSPLYKCLAKNANRTLIRKRRSDGDFQKFSDLPMFLADPHPLDFALQRKAVSRKRRSDSSCAFGFFNIIDYFVCRAIRVSESFLPVNSD